MNSQQVLGLILAGGLSRRMEGGDKSFKLIAGKSLLAHVLARFEPQVPEIVINANGDPSTFDEFRKRVIPDVFEGFAGPLAGVLTGLAWAAENRPDITHVLTVPCDGPFLPRDYAKAMITGLGASDIAMASSKARTHPVAGLWPVRLREGLHQVLEQGVRKVDHWTADYQVAVVPFEETNGVDPFFNANRPGDLQQAEDLMRLMDRNQIVSVEENTTVHMLGLPQDNNSSFLTGPALAPARIRESFHSSSANSFTETGFDLSDSDFFLDAGDVGLEDLQGDAAFDAINDAVSSLILTGGKVLSLGGDHSVAFPVISAHADHYPGLDVLQIDAHPDLYDDMLDNPYSHASPFARLMESGKIGRLVQVGIRTLNKHQREQAARFGVEIHEMRDLSGVADLSFDGPVYLSCDLDGLDPAFAPGVSHYEPGGLSTREVLNIIHNFDGQLVGADVVELNPHRDPGNITAMVAAKIAKELIGRMLEDS